MVKKKNKTERAFVDIKNIVGPSPISLARGLIGESQHIINGYLPNFEQMLKELYPYLGWYWLIALSSATVSNLSSAKSPYF